MFLVFSNHLLASLVLVLVFVLSTPFAPLTSAHFTSKPAITYLEPLQSVRHEILPRTLDHLHKDNGHPLVKRQSGNWLKSPMPIIVQRDDHLRLELRAFNQSYYLHLEPNRHLLHPDLSFIGGGVYDSKDHTARMNLDIFKAFKGIVIQDSSISKKKWDRSMSISQTERPSVEHMLHEEGVLGWARMTIEHDENEQVDLLLGPWSLTAFGVHPLVLPSDSIVLRGAFTVGDDTFHVSTHQHYQVQKRSDDYAPIASTSSRISKNKLLIYRDSDLQKNDNRLDKRATPLVTSCGTRPLSSSSAEPHDYYYPPNLTSPLSVRHGFLGLEDFGIIGTGLNKRNVGDNVKVKVAGPNPVPTGCPANRMISYIGVAADCTYVRSYGGLANARKQIFADFNTASAIYESTFNVALGIKAMVIESMNCPKVPEKGKEWNQECSTKYTINDRLSDFSFWRGQGGRSNDNIGLWHLMTKCSTGSILGIAWTKALCQNTAIAQGSDFTAGAGVSSISPHEWLVVAHEIGHGFGAQHDCTEGTCGTGTCCPLSDTICDAADRYIMNPSEQAATKLFSPCSISAICNTIAGKNGKCLQLPSVADEGKVQKASANVCGNGIREHNEQCDCGSPEECASDPCCDGTTCRFKGKAVCDDLNDDCCHNCQLAPAGFVCRSARSSCDIPETCSGASPLCPPDVLVPDLTVCHEGGNFTGQCARGSCTSRDLQCSLQQRAGITKQCAASISKCDLLCNDPSGAEDTCMKIPGLYFIDGTVCDESGEGTCVTGKCVMPGGWASKHVAIIIPVVCLLMLLIAGGSIAFIRLRRKRKLRSLGSRGRVPSVSGPPHVGPSNGRSGASRRGRSSSAENKNKEADIPRWMLSSNRHEPQTVFSTSRRSSQTILSRRNSAQVHLRNSGDGPAGPGGVGPSPHELQQQYFEQFQHRLQAHEQHRNHHQPAQEHGLDIPMEFMTRHGQESQVRPIDENGGYEHDFEQPVPPYSFQDEVHPFDTSSLSHQHHQHLPPDARLLSSRLQNSRTDRSNQEQAHHSGRHSRR
ncbi:hypothetical protein BGZ94_000743 [Podila epigama]|nr:hypothetical protein BGZ94_000743 [Podila epigama]